MGCHGTRGNFLSRWGMLRQLERIYITIGKDLFGIHPCSVGCLPMGPDPSKQFTVAVPTPSFFGTRPKHVHVGTAMCVYHHIYIQSLWLRASVHRSSLTVDRVTRVAVTGHLSRVSMIKSHQFSNQGSDHPSRRVIISHRLPNGHGLTSRRHFLSITRRIPAKSNLSECEWIWRTVEVVYEHGRLVGGQASPFRRPVAAVVRCHHLY